MGDHQSCPLNLSPEHLADSETQTGSTGFRFNPAGIIGPAWKSNGSLVGQQERTIQHQDQRSISHLFCLDGCRSGCGRDYRLPLEVYYGSHTDKQEPTHPGEMLVEEFLIPMQILSVSWQMPCMCLTSELMSW